VRDSGQLGHCTVVLVTEPFVFHAYRSYPVGMFRDQLVMHTPGVIPASRIQFAQVNSLIQGPGGA
jgi:hypothetical protein